MDNCTLIGHEDRWFLYDCPVYERIDLILAHYHTKKEYLELAKYTIGPGLSIINSSHIILTNYNYEKINNLCKMCKEQAPEKLITAFELLKGSSIYGIK